VARREQVDVDEFRNILDTLSGEREVVAYLRDAPWIPYWTLCAASGHTRYAIFEFPLGSVYQCDLLILNSYSGVWEGYFVEFEPVGDTVFTKRGTPSQCLATAQRQIDDWRQYLSAHPTSLRSDVVRFAKRFDRLGYSSRSENPSNYSGDLLADPSSFFRTRFIIVIGRSSRMSKETRGLLGRYHSGHDVELITYDRLLALAERRYGAKPPTDIKDLWIAHDVP
jgi:hypothetical protein